MPATKGVQKTRFYVDAVVQDPRDSKKGIAALLVITGAKDAEDARKVVEKAVPKIKVRSVELADFLRMMG
jgi:hypothetical protein